MNEAGGGCGGWARDQRCRLRRREEAEEKRGMEGGVEDWGALWWGGLVGRGKMGSGGLHWWGS